MPRSEEANQRIRAEQRTRILEAAWRVFARKGTGATMADIAAEAEVSQGLAYRYFENKEAIITALVERMVQTNDSMIPPDLKLSGTPWQRLEFLIGKILEARRDHPEIFQLFYRSLIDETMPEELRATVARRGLVFQDTLRQLIIEGQAAGQVADDDPDQLVAAIVSYLDGLWRGMAMQDRATIKKFFPDTRIVLRLLRPYPD